MADQIIDEWGAYPVLNKLRFPDKNNLIDLHDLRFELENHFIYDMDVIKRY